MIYTGENKAVLCKGDFCPAQLYKGDTKITGYTETEFEGADGITLENCYNDKLYDVQIRSKNLLDVKKVYPNYVNDEGGITFSNTNFSKVNINMFKHWKENTRYTFSTNYEITNSDNNRVNIRVVYTDGEEKSFWESMGGLFTGNKSGYCSVPTAAGKTVKYMQLAYGTSGRKMDVKFTYMQVEEGTTATEYEPPCRDATITAKSMENTEKTQTVLFENGNFVEEIPTFKGTTVIEIESDTATKISGKYKRME